MLVAGVLGLERHKRFHLSIVFVFLVIQMPNERKMMCIGVRHLNPVIGGAS